MDWDAFLAVEFWALLAMASAVASVIAWGVSYWQQTRSRAEADWVVRPVSLSGPHGADHSYNLATNVTNVGDGYAFRVRATGYECDALLFSEPFPSREFLRRGGTSRAKVPFVPLVQPGQEDGLRVDCQLDSWNRAEIEIEWTPPPTRLRKRQATRIPLREVQPVPQSEPQDRAAE